MYYYFLTDFPAIIKINGEYKGKTDDLLTYNALFSEQVFVEVYPLCHACSPYCFLIDENFLSMPPDNVILTDLKGGYLIKLVLPPSQTPFSIIAQQKFPFAVATVFAENGLKLSIETPTDFYAQSFNFACDDVCIIPFSLDRKQLILIKFGEQDYLINCYLLGEKITPVFSKKVDDFSIENGFFTTERFLDVAKHVVFCEWGLSDNQLVKKSVKVEKSADFDISNLPAHAISYAFLEEYLLSNNVQDYVAENILSNLSHLKNYLGNYLGVMPPPEFRQLEEVGLIYAEGHNKYKVEYFVFTIQDRKICNIKRSDN